MGVFHRDISSQADGKQGRHRQGTALSLPFRCPFTALSLPFHCASKVHSDAATAAHILLQMSVGCHPPRLALHRSGEAAPRVLRRLRGGRGGGQCGLLRGARSGAHRQDLHAASDPAAAATTPAVTPACATLPLPCVFYGLSQLRHCLRIMFPLPSQLRHCLKLCFHCLHS